VWRPSHTTAWTRTRDVQVATVPAKYILPSSLSPSFCPGIPSSPALRAIYTDEDVRWEIRVGAALLWAVHQVCLCMFAGGLGGFTQAVRLRL